MTGRVVLLAVALAVPVRDQGPGHRGQIVRVQSSLAPDDVLRRIGALLDGNDLAGARKAVASALQQYPQDPALHNFAGAIAAQGGDVKTAEQEFQAAIRLEPRQPGPYENLGRLYQEHANTIDGAREKSLYVYKRLLAVDPDNAEGLYQAAFLLALGGSFGESRALLDRLPAEVRGQPQALAVRAVDLAGLGDSHGADAAVTALAAHPGFTAADVAAVQPALERLEDHSVETRMLEALDRRHLATAGSLTRLGELRLAGGDAAAARTTFERAAAATPAGASVPLLIDLARAADKTGDHQGALGYLAHARAMQPDNATVHFMFGIVCVEMNLVREAHDALEKAVALAPDNPFVNYAMGAVAMHGHEPADALPYFEKYVALRPDDARGRLALGVARFYADRFAAARADLAAAATHQDTAATAHYFLARIARQSNDLETAYREVSESVRLNPEYPDAWAELGLVETRRGNYTAAEDALDKALALAPDNYLATVNLATLYARTKDPRREAQAAKLAALQEKRNEREQEFLRIIKVEP